MVMNSKLCFRLLLSLRVRIPMRFNTLPKPIRFAFPNSFLARAMEKQWMTHSQFVNHCRECFDIGEDLANLFWNDMLEESEVEKETRPGNVIWVLVVLKS